MKNILELREAGKVLKTTLLNGGYSYKEYNSGYMVSLAGTERKINVSNTNEYDIQYMIQEFFNEHGTVNTWLDDGTIYLDVSVNIKDRDEALEFAKQNKQLAIYDCKSNKAIELS